MTTAALCCRCVKRCKEPRSTRIIRCPLFQAKEERNEKVNGDTENMAEGDRSPSAAKPEADENKGGK